MRRSVKCPCQCRKVRPQTHPLSNDLNLLRCNKAGSAHVQVHVRTSTICLRVIVPSCACASQNLTRAHCERRSIKYNLRRTERSQHGGRDIHAADAVGQEVAKHDVHGRVDDARRGLDRGGRAADRTRESQTGLGSEAGATALRGALARSRGLWTEGTLAAVSPKGLARPIFDFSIPRQSFKA